MSTEVEYIDQFFSGSLSVEEKQVFEKRLQSDKAFSEEVAFYLSSLAMAREEMKEDKKRKFKELYAGIGKGQETKVVSMRWLRPIIAAAAVIVMIFLAWIFFLKPPSTTQLAERYIREQFSQLGVEMGTAQNKLQEAKSLYNDGKFFESDTILENILKEKPENAEAIKLAGIVSLRMENYDKALGYFQWLAGLTGLHDNPGKLYQALTLMKRNLPGDKQKAKMLLQEVVDKNLSGKEEAESWLKQW